MEISNGTMYVAVGSFECLSLMEWKDQCPSTIEDHDSGPVRCTHQREHGKVSHKGSLYDHGAPAWELWWNDQKLPEHISAPVDGFLANPSRGVKRGRPSRYDVDLSEEL